MMLDMVIDLSDLLDTKLDLHLLPCLPPHKLKKFYDYILNFQLQWVVNYLGLRVSLPLIMFFTLLDARFVALLIGSPTCLFPNGIH
jgi:hypothetical protein